MKEKIYHFEDNGDTFVLSNPRPPREWSNYLWSQEGYICRVNHNAGGDSYYINEFADLCELNNNGSRYFYVRDDNSLKSWNVGEGPMMNSVDNYSCRHHITNTQIQSTFNEIHTSLCVFVPFHGFEEVWTICIKNLSNSKRMLSFFTALNFSLEGFDYPRYHEMYRTMVAFPDKKLNGVFCDSNHHWAPHDRYRAYIASSLKIHAADANLHRFWGANGSFARPELLLDGKDLSNSRRACYDVGGVLQHKIVLLPDQEIKFNIICGLSNSLETARETATLYFKSGYIDELFRDTASKIKKQYESLSLNTPDDKINHVMNNWTKKQIDFCIVGKKGVRDNAQIASALLMYKPEQAMREILEILRHQYQSGNAVLTWLPLDETRYSDQAFWIIWIITELIKETGDYSILDTSIGFQDGGEASVYDHLKRAVNRLLEDLGPNGLVRIYFADWNDALNITDDEHAESVMLTLQFCLALKEFALLCDKIGENEYATFLREKYDQVCSAVNETAWDGEWYMRALSKKGNVGSKNSEGSTIYLNPQVWSVIAGVADDSRLELVLKSIDAMEHDFGFPINKPAYQIFSTHVGRMGLMLHGLYENGGVYSHASAFKIMMDGLSGRGDHALRTLKKIMPDSDLNPYAQSETEPFVFTNCYAIHPDCYGKADRSWLTGTSAWCLKGLVEGILGVRKDYDGLIIDPSLPTSWEHVEINRKFRAANYKILINRQAGKNSGKMTIKVDGNLIEGNLIPPFEDDAIHIVEVHISN